MSLRAARAEADRPAVLVVEHRADLRQLILTTLEAHYRTFEAEDGESAVRRLNELVPDLIVCNFVLPGLSGEQLVSTARGIEALDGVPILLLTAQTDENLRSHLLWTGAQDYLITPFQPDELRLRAHNLVTARRSQLHLQLAERASRETAEFLHLLMHELRSPLAAIHLQIEVLARGLTDAARPVESDVISRITRSSTRVMQVVELLSHFTGLEPGRAPHTVRELDLAAVTAQMVENVRARVVAKPLTIRLEAPARALITSDPALLRLVISNLCEDAIQHTSAGEIVVALDREPDGATRLCVASSNSSCLEPEHQNGLRQARQSEGWRSDDEREVGLRLLLVQRIATVLGAEMALERTEGFGTRVCVTFPTSDPGSNP